jgi:hypothetical protein
MLRREQAAPQRSFLVKGVCHGRASRWTSRLNILRGLLN